MLLLRVSVSPGFHLQGPDGLRIEASARAGAPFAFEGIQLPPPTRIEDPIGDVLTGWHGTLEATLSFSVPKKAAKGKAEIAVRVAHRACGEGACRPEATIALTVPVEIV